MIKYILQYKYYINAGEYMKNGGIDKRVIKTKNAIFDAFKALVQEKDMADITISELTMRANITRSTFYMYYNTVSDVRTDIENQIIARIDKIMSETDLAEAMSSPYTLLSTVADEIVKQDEGNRYILSSSNSGQLLDKINARIVDAYMHRLQEVSTKPLDTGKVRYFIAFAAAGIMECFKIWFNHKSSITLEELCKNISDAVKKGIDLVPLTKTTD